VFYSGRRAAEGEDKCATQIENSNQRTFDDMFVDDQFAL